MRSNARREGMFERQTIRTSSIVRVITFFAIVTTIIGLSPTASIASNDPCAVEWPAPGTEFMKNAAINSPGNEVATSLGGCEEGAYFTNYNDGAGPRDLKYQSPKYVHDALAGTSQTQGYLENGSVVIDSRDNAYDPVNPNDQEIVRRNYTGSGYYSATETVSYKQSGHWGIQTSNWSKVGTTYRVTVKGKYKFDQTQPDGFGEADAECATGFARGDDPQWGLTTTNTATTWTDKYIPAHYAYVFMDKHANIKGTFTEEEIYGEKWLPHRFDYDFAVNKGTPFEQTALSDDGFDLEFGWARGPVEWAALEKDIKGNLYPSGEPCSSINTYSYDFVGTGRPIHFVLGDFVRYGEWDNCGTLSIEITKSQTGYADPSVPPYGVDACHWVPDYSARTIFMKDLNAKNMSHPYYFDPLNYATSDAWFDPERGVTATAKVTWGNLGSGPHSVTAAVAKDGTFCTNVVSLGALDLGKDDCDKRGIQRLFDSNPACPVFGPCNTGAGGFTWTVSLSAAAEQKLCDDEYCSIPYFCRVKPDEMRGTIVVKRTT